MLLITAPAWGLTLHVENWGTDSGTCGTSTAPCRSIGKAVALAVSGNTVLVGPGRYSSNLDGDSNFNEPGEEPSTGISIGPGVTVKSTHGAAVTRIEYTNSLPDVIAGGSNAIFGTRNHGFSLLINSAFFFSGAEWISFPTGGSVSGNVIYVTNSAGGTVVGIAASGGTVVRDNRVVAADSSSLFVAIASNDLVERNVVIGAWGPGSLAAAGATLRHNVVLENGYGFLLQGQVTELTKNIAMANGNGVVADVGSSVAGALQKNTIVGNDPVTNCGLYNNSGTALTASKNFWGPGGPGPDPADDACNNGAGSSTTTTPFLSKPVAPGPGALQ